MGAATNPLSRGSASGGPPAGPGWDVPKSWTAGTARCRGGVAREPHGPRLPSPPAHSGALGVPEPSRGRAPGTPGTPGPGEERHGPGGRTGCPRPRSTGAQRGGRAPAACTREGRGRGRYREGRGLTGRGGALPGGAGPRRGGARRAPELSAAAAAPAPGAGPGTGPGAGPGTRPGRAPGRRPSRYCGGPAPCWHRSGPVLSPGAPGGGPGLGMRCPEGREGDTGVRGGEGRGGVGVPRVHPMEVPPDPGLSGGCWGPAAPRTSSEDTGPRAAALRCAHAFTPPPLPVPSVPSVPSARGRPGQLQETRDVPGSSSQCRCSRCCQSQQGSPRHLADACGSDPGCCRAGGRGMLGSPGARGSPATGPSARVQGVLLERAVLPAPVSSAAALVRGLVEALAH
ncbi:hypothetical protein LUU34_01061200 [Aix galericulata]|nr:hypothetical protein LUU34_01061200 [Aix galericulata]